MCNDPENPPGRGHSSSVKSAGQPECTASALFSSTTVAGESPRRTARGDLVVEELDEVIHQDRTDKRISGPRGKRPSEHRASALWSPVQRGPCSGCDCGHCWTPPPTASHHAPCRTSRSAREARPSFAVSLIATLGVAIAARALLTLGYVKRERDPSDRRRNTVTLTPSGLITLGRFEAAIEAAQDAVLAAFSPADRATLIELLERLVRTAGQKPLPDSE